MERKAVVLVNTAIEFGDSYVWDFAEFCAEWLSRHSGGKMTTKVKLLYVDDSEDEENQEPARRFLASLLPSFEKRGIEAEPVVKRGTLKGLAYEVNALKPEVVFLTESKTAKNIKNDLEGLLVEHPDPRRGELRASEIYGIAALVLYAVIFTSFEALKGIMGQKSFLSVALILGTVVAVAYLYGNTISHALKYLGIKPKHAQ